MNAETAAKSGTSNVTSLQQWLDNRAELRKPEQLTLFDARKY